MFKPIITPNQTAVIFALGSANSIGATIGTTTTAISIKSKKNPKTNITAITIRNLDQNPPGREFRNSRTRSSPPKALKAEVKTAAPSKIMNTNEVVFAVSNMTPCRTLPILLNRRRLQVNDIINPVDAITPNHKPCMSREVCAAFAFIS